MEKYLELSDFLKSYFHQDWMVENLRPEVVVRQFKLDSSDEVLMHQIADEIDAYLHSPPSTRPTLYDLGSFYDPTLEGSSVADWLTGVRDLLASPAAKESDVGTS